MHKKFPVAVTARNRADQPMQNLQAVFRAAGANALLHYGIQGGIFYDACFANLARLQFKLRLDQHQHLPAGLQPRQHRRQHQSERNE